MQCICHFSRYSNSSGDKYDYTLCGLNFIKCQLILLEQRVDFVMLENSSTFPNSIILKMQQKKGSNQSKWIHQWCCTVLQFPFEKRWVNGIVECPAYPAAKVPIKKLKVEDIKKVLSYIPEDHGSFYNEILLWPTMENNNADDNNWKYLNFVLSYY